MMMLSGSTPSVVASVSSPYSCSSLVQFGAIWIPAPTSPNSLARSSTRTRRP